MSEPKRAAGEAAAQLVEDGMTVGLGTGSTTAYAIHAIGRRIREENLSVRGVPTSFSSERLAREAGIPLVTLDEVDHLDIGIDGADEVDPELNLIKGGGAAHTREKVVAALCERFVVVADPSKEVERLGSTFDLPVEVVPMAVGPVTRRIVSLGGQASVREGVRKDGPVVTDQGLWVLDAHFEGDIDDPQAVADALSREPGVLEHGLFLGMATDLLIGQEDGSCEHRQR